MHSLTRIYLVPCFEDVGYKTRSPVITSAVGLFPKDTDKKIALMCVTTSTLCEASAVAELKYEFSVEDELDIIKLAEYENTYVLENPSLSFLLNQFINNIDFKNERFLNLLKRIQ